MICIIKVSYWGAFPNSARLFCIYIIVALHIFPNFDFFSRPYIVPLLFSVLHSYTCGYLHLSLVQVFVRTPNWYTLSYHLHQS